MKIKYYQFGYSGIEGYEGYKRFRKLSRIKSFLQKVPPEELRYTTTTAWDGKYWYMGAYFVLKRGGLSIRF